jgi:hypothetical protein
MKVYILFFLNYNYILMLQRFFFKFMLISIYSENIEFIFQKRNEREKKNYANFFISGKGAREENKTLKMEMPDNK